jgi:hypothetical protein
MPSIQMSAVRNRASNMAGNLRFSRALIVSLLVVNLAFPRTASAIEESLQLPASAPEDTLVCLPGTHLSADGWHGKFHLGGWPENATTSPPFDQVGLAIVQGRWEDQSWANPHLRVHPARSNWLTNTLPGGLDETLNMGRGPISVAFEEDACAVRLRFAMNSMSLPGSSGGDIGKYWFASLTTRARNSA